MGLSIKATTATLSNLVSLGHSLCRAIWRDGNSSFLSEAFERIEQSEVSRLRR